MIIHRHRYVALFLALGTLGCLALSSAGCGTGGTSPVLGCTSSSFTPNYAEAVGLSRLRHWDEFPVRVFFKNDVNFDRGNGQVIQLSQKVREGIQAWTNSISAVTWVEVSSVAQADVTIELNVLSSEPGPGDELGVTTVSFNPSTNGLTLAEVVINVWDGMTLTNADVDLPQTSAHEFGQALGIGGHSDNDDDLMFPSAATGTLTDITARDRNTLRTAYCGTFPTAQVRTRSPQDNVVRETIVTTVGDCTLLPQPRAVSTSSTRIGQSVTVRQGAR